jgi:maltooligosyltrehalose trehalohydrolase
MAPFVPMLFQGEEWGASTPWQYFTDHESPELAEAVRNGRRAEFAAFGWAPADVPDPQDPATFARSQLDWDELANPAHTAMLAWHQLILGLRADQPALRDGRLDAVKVAHDAHTITITRGPVTLVANLGGDWVERPRPPGALLLASQDGVVDAAPFVRLPHETAAFWVVPAEG